MIERKAYRYRLYPDADQLSLMARTAGCCRVVYNLALERRRVFGRPGRRIGYVSQAAELAALKHEAPWLKEVPHHCLQQALRDLDRAFQNFFAGRASYPKPRKRFDNDAFRFPDPKQFRIELTNDPRFVALFLPKLGRVKLRLHRQIKGEMKNVIVSREGNCWFASIQTEIEMAKPVSRLADDPIGMGLGVAQPITLSIGEVIDLARIGEQEKRFVARLRRQVARKVRGSKNARRAAARLRNVLAGQKRRRRDAAGKATTAIARSHGVVFCEDIRLKNMTASARSTLAKPGRMVRQKAGLNRAMLDVAPGQIRLLLGQKLSASGGLLTTVPARHISQRCQGCGHVDAANRISQSKFWCVACGHEAHADINAACDMRDRGMGRWDYDPASPQVAISTSAGGRPVPAWAGSRVSGPTNQESGSREAAMVAA